LTGLLPVAQGVAVYASLSRAADSLRASGDERGRGQIMADTLVERVTGQATADRVPVEVQLVITDRTLLTGILHPEPITASGGSPETPGAPGVPGTPGVPGVPGAPGAPGVSGVLVAPGMSGATGTPGAPGIPGATGASGAMGSSLATTAHRDTPAYFPGYGIVPGVWGRELVRSALDTGKCREASSDTESSRRDAPVRPGPEPEPEPSVGPEPAPDPTVEPAQEHASLVSLRRLYLDPLSGELTAMESKARAFPAGLARLIRTRDQTCRTPWCDAPIRHIDHIQPHAEGGPTSYTNGQGLCEACNQAKEAPGWSAATIRAPGSSARIDAAEIAAAPRSAPHGPATRHTVRTTTPTGHTHISTAPSLPGNP
ncbi:HNH endonuclease, partial [Arthrobacter citreus]